MKQSLYEAVIFDMDGVIFDSEKMVIICWQEVADKYHIENIRRHFSKIYGLDKGMHGYFDYATLEGARPTCQGYATTHGIIGQTFEGFCGFAGREEFSGETVKANCELIGNWLFTVLLHYKKFYDMD